MNTTNWIRATVAVAAALSASAVTAQPRSRTGYRQVAQWAQLPPGYTWGTMSAVAIDQQGNIYGFQRDAPTSKVIVFDARGRYLKTWGEGAFPYAHGMRALNDGYIWTTDRQAQVVLKFNGDGKLLFTLGRKGVAGSMESTDAFNGASDVAMADNGDIFVSDGEGQNTRIVKLSNDGRFIKAWARRAPGLGSSRTRMQSLSTGTAESGSPIVATSGCRSSIRTVSTSIR